MVVTWAQPRSVCDPGCVEETCIRMAGGTHRKRNPKAGKVDEGLHRAQRKSVDPEGRDRGSQEKKKGP